VDDPACQTYLKDLTVCRPLIIAHKFRSSSTNMPSSPTLNFLFDQLFDIIDDIIEDLLEMRRELDRGNIPKFSPPPPYTFDPMRTIGRF
jgi:hypothetical protein